MSSIRLEPIDRELLDGVHGAAAARAFGLLMQYGAALDAEHFVSIQSAHIDGCLYHGQSSIDFVQSFVDLGGKVRVPTTLNVAAVDVVHPGWNQGPEDVLAAQAELTRLHEELGCLATLTCAPYQRMLRPKVGEQIAWGESNAIVFANSVLGARTDRYGDFTDLCAALTGRVPCVGFHRTENRLATLAFKVPLANESLLERDIFFACLGYVMGKRAGTQVPVLLGLPGDATEDELKALGASAASSGSTALFHAVGVTPEATSLAAATGGADVPTLSIDQDDLLDALKELCPLHEGEPIAAMCLGTPHFSISEFRHLATLVEGRRAASNVEVYVSTSREIAAQVEQETEFAAIGAFGTRIVVDTCTYHAPVVRDGTGAIVTNSGKWAHYGPGNLHRRVGLMSMDRCVRSAQAGLVAPR